MKPEISVIIPAKNEEKTIGNAIRSVQKQGFESCEVIVVDGGSTDRTAEIARSLGAKVVREAGKERSPANARNIGIKNANADIILMMDGDWELVRGFRDALGRFREKKVHAVTCRCIIGKCTLVERVIASKFEQVTPIYPYFLCRKKLLEGVGGFNPGLGFGEDREISGKISDYLEKNDLEMGDSSALVLMHSAHSIKELYAQHKWYGRTVPGLIRAVPTVPNILILGKAFFPLFFLGPIFLALKLPYYEWVSALSLPYVIPEAYLIAKRLLQGRPHILLVPFIDLAKNLAFAEGILQYLSKKRHPGRDRQ